MAEIEVERRPPQDTLQRLGVLRWPVWTKEVSVFPWTYSGSETCYILEGEVIVTPDGGEPVRLGAGDLVTFPDGMSCTWDVRAPVRKHYSFG
jgi:uncharacterized cupin superfamily protein